MEKLVITKLVDRLPVGLQQHLARHAWLNLCLQTAVLLGLFLIMELLIMRISAIPPAHYHQSSLTLALLQRIGLPGCIALLAVAGLLWRYAFLASPWQAIDQGQRLRYFTVFLALVIAWPLTTYGYNFYFDQGHYLDRGLLLLLLGLLWWRPVFIFPFLVLAFTLLWQLQHPSIGGTILAHKLQVLHLLNLFAAAFAFHIVSGYRNSTPFVFLACCLVASAYWLPAWAKLQLDWLSHGHLYRLPLAAYAHGWLAFWEPAQLVTLAKSIAWLDWPMRIAVIVVEAGCLLFLLHRKLSLALLAGVMLFHLGVFALYGFLFWTWILVDAALLVLLLKDLPTRHWSIYGRGPLLLSVALISVCSYWAKPPALAWLDTRLSYTYQLEAVTDSGRRFVLPATFFAPYEDVFTMASFSYLVKDHGVLVGPYAVTNQPVIAEALNKATTPAAVFALEQSQQQRRHHPARSASFYEFVRRFVANHNARATDVPDLRQFAPPRQFWSYWGDATQIGREPIREVVVNELTTLYDEKELRVIRRLELARLTIPAENKPPSSE